MIPRQEQLPLCTIRESGRAKRVRLLVTPAEGLVAVVPAGFDRKLLPEMLEEKRDWIARSLRWALERQRLTPARQTPLPAKIMLQSVSESWRVTYHPGRGAVRVNEKKGEELAVRGAMLNRDDCRRALVRWLGRRARRRLIPMLDELSAGTGLEYRRASIGDQRSRWGSCSPLGTISINRKLLFLPRRQVRYVLVHELCHTVHLDHSRRFWTLLAEHQPGARALDRELNRADSYLPAWCNQGSRHVTRR